MPRFPWTLERVLARPWPIITATAILVALPFLAAGEIGARDARDRFHEEAITSAAEASQRGAAVAGAHMGEITRAVEAVGGSGDLRGLLFSGSTGAAMRVFRQYLTFIGSPGVRPEIAAYWVTDSMGNAVFGERQVPGRGWSPLGGEVASIAGLRFFQETMRRGTPVPGPAPTRTDAVISEDLPRIMVAGTESLGPTVSFPVPGAALGSPPTGVVVVQLRPDEIVGWVHDQVGADGELYLVTGNGVLIGRTSGSPGAGTDLSGSTLFTGAAARTAAGDREDPVAGGTRVIAAAAVTGVGWYVVASFGLTRAERELASSLDDQRLVRIGLAALLLIAAYLFARAAGEVVRQRRVLADSLQRQTALSSELSEKSGQLEAASRHKSEFLANMSHELRTPLNAVIGFSDVLEQRMAGELNERQAEYVQDISSSGKHLLELVNEILDLSKVEAGKMELERSEFALTEAIHAALAFVRERAAQRRIELAADLADDLGTVFADERKIRQVLLNLLSNAVKFTSDGGRIGVSARRGVGEVRVSVRDTGIGIALEDQAKVFEEFQQVGKTSDRSREGTGLGLTLAKRFVELHGGRIWLESEMGKGTTFTFALPVGRPAAAVA